MPTDSFPKEFPGVTPVLVTDDSPTAIKFYEEAFDAKVLGGARESNGKWWYCELFINGGRMMVQDVHPDDMPFKAPTAEPPAKLGGTASLVHIYVNDVDASYRRAIEAGAKSLQEPTDLFWGDRNAGIIDPAGHRWIISTRVKNVDLEWLTRVTNEAVAETEKARSSK
ncbi:VOC family protein [Nocardia sp. NPDC051321]|uniref:VOC family protein n=1 Tax=Nocardia sp. NPDC051321 TaxID=3364323 RepID=UPI00378B728A